MEFTKEITDLISESCNTDAPESFKIFAASLRRCSLSSDWLNDPGFISQCSIALRSAAMDRKKLLEYYGLPEGFRDHELIRLELFAALMDTR